jgi:hypothetical protein
MKPISHYLKNAFSRRSEAIARQPSDRPGPDFICFGMQKAGTRWVYDQMNAREDVWMPPIKEINFFTKRCLKEGNLRALENNTGSLPLIAHPSDELKRQEFCRHFSTYDPARSDLEWYRALFDLKGDRLSGDVSPNYSELETDDIRLIAKELPRAKFIMLIREPVDRVWSALCMALRKKKVSAETITNWDTLLPSLAKRRREMKSLPSALWKRWSSEIPEDHIRYWFFDDICSRPNEVVDEICGFLEIKPGPGALPANHNSKQGNQKVNMPDHIRERLVEYYAEEIKACADVFGGHAITWREKRLGSRP